MATVPANPDVGGLLEPGVFTAFNIQGSGAAEPDTNKSVHVVGYRSSGGAGAPDAPTLYTAQSDVDADHGRGSDAARRFAEVVSQGGNPEVWVTGIADPGGTAATYIFKLTGTATKGGWRSIAVDGYVLKANFANGATAAEVATAMYGQRNALLDSPCTVADNGGGQLTFTYRHAAEVGNDCPFVVDGSTDDGITVSNGTLTYTTGVTGAGSATVTIGATTITAAIANGDTAAQAATKVAAAINGGNYPVTCTDDSAGALTIIPRFGRVMRRLSAAIVTSTGISVAVTLHGTSGSGTPTLTTALTNIAALNRGWAAWVFPFTDATSLGALATHLENEGNGVVQKNQCAFIGSASKLTTAGALTTAGTPTLRASVNSGAVVLWVKDAPNQAAAYAARFASAYATLSPDEPQNYNGLRLKTAGTVPIGVTPLVERPGRADREAAMSTYGMTVGMVDGGGYMTIERGRTASNAANEDMHELITVRQLHTARPSLNSYLRARFSGLNYRVNGTPRTSRTTTPASVKDAVIAWATDRDSVDLFDGIDVWRDLIACTVDPVVAGRFRIFVPLAIVRGLHQLTSTISPK